jgi:hypothetical protein
MKAIAIFMVLVGLATAWGAAMEFGYFGPESVQFWVGVFVTPAGLFFVFTGVMLWLRGHAARALVLVGACAMASATIAATLLRVMGPPATILGLAAALTAAGWAWRSRTLAV